MRSPLSVNEPCLFGRNIVEEFNKGLEATLVQDQAVGELREGFKGSEPSLGLLPGPKSRIGVRSPTAPACEPERSSR